MGVNSFEASLSISLALGLFLCYSYQTGGQGAKNQVQGSILPRMEKPGHTSILGPKTQMTALMPLVTTDGYLFVIFSLLAFF